MKIRTILIAAGFTLAALPTLQAQEKPGRDAQRRGLGLRPNTPGAPRGEMPTEGIAQRMGQMMRGLPLMMALDTDENGVLSKAEIDNASKSLMKLDKDGDGILSADELRPEPGLLMPPGSGGRPGELMQAGAGMMVKMLEQRDKNGDGKLTGDEIPERLRDRLNMVDTNGDGAIDKAELEKAMARMGDRLGRPGERGDQNGQGVKPRRPPTDGDN